MLQYKTTLADNGTFVGFYQKMLILKFVSDRFDNPDCFLDI